MLAGQQIQSRLARARYGNLAAFSRRAGPQVISLLGHINGLDAGGNNGGGKALENR